MIVKKAAVLLVCLISIATALVLTGCDGVQIEFKITKPSPIGQVVNVKTGTGLSGATVTLSYIGGASTADKPTSAYSTTSDSVGKFAFSEVVPGQYELTASKTGYAFIKRVVDVTGEGYTLPNVGGFIPGDNDLLTIFVMWDPSFDDVDAHITFPNTDVTSAAGAPVIDATYTDFYKPFTDNGWETGFFPDSITSYRDDVYYTHMKGPIDSSFSNEASVELDVDNRGAPEGDIPGGPETVTLRYFPFTDDASNVSYTAGTDDPSTLPEGTYTWIGVMEYYLQAYKKNSTTSFDNSYLSESGKADSANAVVYAFNGSTQIGIYTIPTFTNLKTVSVLRINMFKKSDGYEWFQLLPDIRTVDDTNGIRSLDSTNGIVSVGGRVRR